MACHCQVTNGYLLEFCAKRSFTGTTAHLTGALASKACLSGQRSWADLHKYAEQTCLLEIRPIHQITCMWRARPPKGCHAAVLLLNMLQLRNNQSLAPCSICAKPQAVAFDRLQQHCKGSPGPPAAVVPTDLKGRLLVAHAAVVHRDQSSSPC